MVKNSQNEPLSLKTTVEDQFLDLALRPKTWNDFIGQEKLKKNLKIILEAAKKRGESFFEHILFYGNSGLGKTSLSYLVAKEMGVKIKTTTGPAIKKIGDLASVLTNLEDGDILFVDECHRMNKAVEEFLYPALEDFKINLVIGSGPMARTMDLRLPHFTFIGATTKAAMISAPLRNRLGATFQLNFYLEEDIEKIIKRSAELLNVKIEPEAIKILARCSRFTPRVANRLLKRARDFAQVEGNGVVTEKTAKDVLEFLEIDKSGLESSDRKILETLISKFQGGPVGVQTLAAATAEEEEAIIDLYEPYLMRLGFIERTPRGRMATKNAYLHLGIEYKNQNRLFS